MPGASARESEIAKRMLFNDIHATDMGTAPRVAAHAAILFNRNSPNDSLLVVNFRTSPASLQDRREMRAAMGHWVAKIAAGRLMWLLSPTFRRHIGQVWVDEYPQWI